MDEKQLEHLLLQQLQASSHPGSATYKTASRCTAPLSTDQLVHALNEQVECHGVTRHLLQLASS
jgi:hypothetical protein